jgi:hypothetical protein
LNPSKQQEQSLPADVLVLDVLKLTSDEMSLAFKLLVGYPQQQLPPNLQKLEMAQWQFLAILLATLEREKELHPLQ